MLALPTREKEIIQGGKSFDSFYLLVVYSNEANHFCLKGPSSRSFCARLTVLYTGLLLAACVSAGPANQLRLNEAQMKVEAASQVRLSHYGERCRLDWVLTLAGFPLRLGWVRQEDGSTHLQGGPNSLTNSFRTLTSPCKSPRRRTTNHTIP